MKFTLEMLESSAVCSEQQVAIFRAEWPEGVEVTLEAIARALELGLDVGWAVNMFANAPARATYRAALATAKATYLDVLAQAAFEALSA